MANFVRSRFTLIGNDEVKNYSADLRSKLDEAASVRQDYDEDLRVVGRVVYGLDNDNANLGYDEVGAKWVMVDGDVIDSGLAFVSGWEPPTLLQDYILKELSKLDLHAIVLMEYEDEGPNFAGARYVVMNSGQIQEEDFREDLSDCQVVSYDELDDAIEENKETEEYDRVITWDDIQSIVDKQKEMAFENIQSSNDWIKDELLNTPWYTF